MIVLGNRKKECFSTKKLAVTFFVMKNIRQRVFFLKSSKESYIQSLNLKYL